MFITYIYTFYDDHCMDICCAPNDWFENNELLQLNIRNIMQGLYVPKDKRSDQKLIVFQTHGIAQSSGLQVFSGGYQTVKKANEILDEYRCSHGCDSCDDCATISNMKKVVVTFMSDYKSKCGESKTLLPVLFITEDRLLGQCVTIPYSI